MPVKKLRICQRCDGRIRWAPCGIACRVGDDWVDNLQRGAGEMLSAPRELRVVSGGAA